MSFITFINNLILFIMRFERIMYGNGVELLTETQMKATRAGGYGYGDDDETYGPYELPEVTITCGQYSGQCWDCELAWSGAYTGECRRFTGDQSHYCGAIRVC